MRKWLVSMGVAAMVGGLVLVIPMVARAAHPTEVLPPDDTTDVVLSKIHRQVTQALRSCYSFSARHYDACRAYVIDASLEARMPYYIFGTSNSATWSGFATQRIEERYQGQALRYLRTQTSGWPAALARATVPTISVNSIRLSDDRTQATLITHETWRVTSVLGQSLLRESNKQHIVIMQRHSGIWHHTWAVTSIK